MRRFWDFDESGEERVLHLEGAIAEETWWGDEVTPAAFKADLNAGQGDITIWINSPGGDVFAAHEIYTALQEYPGKVTVKISAVAASAASVIAMAGDEVLMSPVACMMIHNPATIAIGDSVEMLRAKEMLDSIKESIINAYTLKTGLSRKKVSDMMDGETWLFAQNAIKMGFADGMLYAESQPPASPGNIFTRLAITNSLLAKLPEPGAATYNYLEARLHNLSH